MWLKMMIRNRNDCVLTPIPQYPLYSACLELYNGTLLPYYLDEERGWALSIPELKQQVEAVGGWQVVGDWGTGGGGLGEGSVCAASPLCYIISTARHNHHHTTIITQPSPHPQARAKGLCVRALVVINPGNPTGNVLDYDNQREIIDFCKEYGIVLMADEVYQTNICMCVWV